MNQNPTPPPEVREFTIANAAYELCDQSMDIADRGSIPTDMWDDAVETVTVLADRGLLAWIESTEHGWQPWAPGTRSVWEYGVERSWGTEWGASVGMSHRYDYTAENVHALASGNPVFRRLRTITTDTVSDPQPYPKPAPEKATL